MKGSLGDPAKIEETDGVPTKKDFSGSCTEGGWGRGAAKLRHL